MHGLGIADVDRRDTPHINFVDDGRGSLRLFGIMWLPYSI